MLVYQKIRNRNELSTIEGKAYCNQNSEQGIVDPEAGLCYIHNDGNQGKDCSPLRPTHPYATISGWCKTKLARAGQVMKH